MNLPDILRGWASDHQLFEAAGFSVVVIEIDDDEVALLLSLESKEILGEIRLLHNENIIWFAVDKHSSAELLPQAAEGTNIVSELNRAFQQISNLSA